MVKRPNPQSRERGFTVVEVTIVVAISVVLFLAVGALTDASGTSMDYLSRTHRVDRDLRRALADISADLKRCSAGGLVHDTSDTDHDLITLQVPNPNGVGAPQWGYFQEDGAFQARWRA
ncbi:MAG: prepilin-type N-terminal cleavage/methylation domain-containing protein [Planctomycetota bacterium]